MAYDTDLQSNNAELQEILNTINALPEAGSGGSGGGSLDTCTLKIIDNLGYGSVSVSYQTFSDGVITHIFNNRLPSGESVFENVLCNSAVSLTEAAGSSVVSSVNLNMVGNILGMFKTFTVTANMGATATITINANSDGGW